MKKNMLFVSFDPIEFRRRVLNEIETAEALGFNVKVISVTKAKIIKQQFDFEYISITLPQYINKGFIAYPLFSLILLFKTLSKKFDVIHFRGLIPIPALLIRQWINKSLLIYDAHEYFRGHLIFKNRHIRRTIWMWFEKIIIKHLETIITVCEPLAELLKQDYPNTKDVKVIRSVPLLSKYRDQNVQKSDAERIVIFHGYLLPGRALENIIHAMVAIKDETIKLQIIGEGILKGQLVKLTNELGLSSIIQFHPMIANEQLIEFISKADLGLTIIEADCPNRKYALPNKFFEYIHAGVPVLASNIPTLQMYVDNYKIGQTVDPNNIEGIAQTIESMLANKEKVIQWKVNCRKAALDLNWEKEQEKLGEIYRNLFH